MTRAALHAILAHWRRRRLQLAALVLGLAIATALWTGVQAINAEARASYARAAERLAAAALPRVARDGALTMRDFVALRRGGWLVTPVVEGRTSIGGIRVNLLGIDPLTAPASLRPGALAPGGGIPAPGTLVAAPGLARRIGALAEPSLPPDLAVAELGEAQRRLGLGDRLTRLDLLPRQPLRQEPLARLGPYRISVPPAPPDLAQLTRSFHLNLAAFGLLAFTVGLFVVHGTIGLAFEERRPLLRTLRALGLPLGHIALAMAIELLALALAAGVLGVVLGGLVAASLLPDVAASLAGLYGAEVPGTLSLRPSWCAAGMGMALAGTALAGAGSFRRLARLPLLAPARPRAWARAAARGARRRGLLGLGLCLAAGLVLARNPGLGAGFGAMGALMIGAALCLPAVLGALLGLCARAARGPGTRWFWSDTVQQLPGLSLALGALLLALAANIGVSTMVGSFRQTFTAWLDQRLAATLYVTARDREDAENLARWLRPRVEAVLPIWDAQDRVAGMPLTLYGIADDPLYRRNWPLLSAVPGVWDRLAAGEGVLVNEQLARRLSLGPDSRLPLSGWAAPVLGTYSDYGNPEGQAMMALHPFLALYPEADRTRFGLRLPGESAPALALALVNDYGLPPGNLTDQAARKRVALAVFDRTFLVTGALNLLTLGVAGFALFTSLATLAAMRLPQLAPAWAIGLARRRLAALEILRALGLAALAWVLSLPLGLALAWALLARINVAAFGWRIPLRLFPDEWLRLLALALAVALAAAALQAWRLTRRPPAALLGVFSGDR